MSIFPFRSAYDMIWGRHNHICRAPADTSVITRTSCSVLEIVEEVCSHREILEFPLGRRKDCASLPMPYDCSTIGSLPTQRSRSLSRSSLSTHRLQRSACGDRCTSVLLGRQHQYGSCGCCCWPMCPQRLRTSQSPEYAIERTCPPSSWQRTRGLECLQSCSDMNPGSRYRL